MDEVTNKRKLYSLRVSSSSCRLDDIQGFVYGGMTSRFWMLRKHINSLSSEYFKKNTLPFYSWDCITLQLEDKEVYLVINNEKQMEAFIKLLIYKLETIDGNRGSATPLKN